jgi:2-keto-4-pentenoate hydratase
MRWPADCIDTMSTNLIEAERSRRPLPSASGRYPDFDHAMAYAVQLRTLETKLAGGASIIGAKAAFTNKVVQKEYGVDEPVSGFLLDRGLCRDGAEIPFDNLIEARVEAEIAFVMAGDLAGPGASSARALNAVAGIMPAIEVVDCRFANWKVRAVDVAADNACSGHVVLGGGMFPAQGIDLRLLGVIMERNGEVVSTGAGAAALGNPIEVLAWVANNLGKLGRGLRAGDVVIAGTLVRAEQVKRGHRFRATFDRLGAVSVSFA